MTKELSVRFRAGEKMKTSLAVLILITALGGAAAAQEVVRSDHDVSVVSGAPGMKGGTARLYVREVKLAKPEAPSKGVVLFVHGAGTPAEVSFDVPAGDFSWMAYLARAGFDVFSMDMEGYGRSTRPPAMADPCNLPTAQQVQFIPAQIKAACPHTITGPVTTMGSDWSDIEAVVDQLLTEHHLKQLALVAWSQGGPRTGGYVTRHPEKVSRLIVLAPAYNPDMPTLPPQPFPPGDSMNSQSQSEFKANWDRQAPCPGQYELATAAAVWSELVASDSVGKTWGTGVRRAPNVPSWGFNKETVAKITTPYLMVSGENDKQVSPARVRQLYDDLGAPDKVLVDLACSSHNAMWEKNHLLLFKASLDWLTTGRVEGKSRGEIKLGY
jgi:pimeloyl-ACP methyl ester carboxylesterase